MYGDIDLGQHWLRVVSIIWTNVVLLSEVFSGIHLIEITQEVSRT